MQHFCAKICCIIGLGCHATTALRGNNRYLPTLTHPAGAGVTGAVCGSTVSGCERAGGSRSQGDTSLRRRGASFRYPVRVRIVYPAFSATRFDTTVHNNLLPRRHPLKHISHHNRLVATRANRDNAQTGTNQLANARHIRLSSFG